ncbi:hypothetical protein ACLOJK_013772 [Asimina triloba]
MHDDFGSPISRTTLNDSTRMRPFSMMPKGRDLKPLGGSTNSIIDEGASGKTPRGGQGGREASNKGCISPFSRESKESEVTVSSVKDLQTMLIEVEDDQILEVEGTLPLRAILFEATHLQRPQVTLEATEPRITPSKGLDAWSPKKVIRSRRREQARGHAKVVKHKAASAGGQAAGENRGQFFVSKADCTRTPINQDNEEIFKQLCDVEAQALKILKDLLLVESRAWNMSLIVKKGGPAELKLWEQLLDTWRELRDLEERIRQIDGCSTKKLEKYMSKARSQTWRKALQTLSKPKIQPSKCGIGQSGRQQDGPPLKPRAYHDNSPSRLGPSKVDETLVLRLQRELVKMMTTMMTTMEGRDTSPGGMRGKCSSSKRGRNPTREVDWYKGRAGEAEGCLRTLEEKAMSNIETVEAKVIAFQRKVAELETKLQRALKAKAVGTLRGKALRSISNDIRDLVLAEYLSSTRYKAMKEFNCSFFIREGFRMALKELSIHHPRLDFTDICTDALGVLQVDPLSETSNNNILTG